jgi:hypothetical protein
MKDYRKIDEILERYWLCETSVEEEKALQDFFLNEQDIPSHLIQYQSLFEYRDAKQTEKLPDNFDEKILNKIGAQPKRKKIYFLRAMKVAASIVLLISLGLTAYIYHVRTEQTQARETVLDALFMISDNLQKGEEMIIRGLEDFIIP